MPFEFIKLHGKKISPYLNELANLRITVFKEFPYLYEGSLEYEQKYLKTYQDCSDSMVVIALFENKVIGATTCIPMIHESDEFKQSLIQKGIDLSRVMYFGESIILKEFRGKKIGHKFFDLREKYSKELIEHLEYSCFCAVDRDLEHPLRPENYQGLDNFWKRMGYDKKEDMKVYYPWKDIDKEFEDNKSMTIWMKEWK